MPDPVLPPQPRSISIPLDSDTFHKLLLYLLTAMVTWLSTRGNPPAPVVQPVIAPAVPSKPPESTASVGTNLPDAVALPVAKEAETQPAAIEQPAFPDVLAAATEARLDRIEREAKAERLREILARADAARLGTDQAVVVANVPAGGERITHSDPAVQKVLDAHHNPPVAEPVAPLPAVAPPVIPATQKINANFWSLQGCRPCEIGWDIAKTSTKFNWTKSFKPPLCVQRFAAQGYGYPLVSFVGPKGDMVMQWPGSNEAFEAEYSRVWKAGGAGKAKAVYLKDCK